MAKSVPTAASATRITNFLLEKGLAGVPPLSSAENLGAEYLIDQGYETDDERVDSLINWETTKNFTSGFITGLGGVVSLPLSIPSALGASWLLQARMAGAIAHIYGHDLRADRVRTMILLSLAGDVARDAMKVSGVKPGDRLTERALAQVPGRVLVEINKRIGVRLLTRAGERGAIGLSRAIPIAGGFVGGAFDAVVCRAVGRTAKSFFRRPWTDDVGARLPRLE
jgi:uncharacterized protein (DUF697 family)